MSKRESGVIRLAGRTLGIMTERSRGAGHGARVRWPDPQIAGPGGAIGERRGHLTCQRVRAPDLLGLRDETRNLGVGLCGQVGVLVDQAAQPGTADERPSAHDLVCWHRHIEIKAPVRAFAIVVVDVGAHQRLVGGHRQRLKR